MDPKVMSIIVIVLTFVAWVMEIITLADDYSIWSVDWHYQGWNSWWASCGPFGHCCGSGGFLQTLVKMFGVVGCIFTGFVGILHILQAVNVLHKIVPSQHHANIKWLHTVAAGTNFLCWVFILILYIVFDCSPNGVTVSFDRNIGFAIFLYIVIVIFNLICFYLCGGPSGGSGSGVQPLLNA